MSSLGEAIRIVRERRGMSQQAVADDLRKLGYDIRTRSGIRRIEERGPQKYALLRLLSTVLGVDLSDIERIADIIEAGGDPQKILEKILPGMLT